MNCTPRPSQQPVHSIVSCQDLIQFSKKTKMNTLAYGRALPLILANSKKIGDEYRAYSKVHGFIDKWVLFEPELVLECF